MASRLVACEVRKGADHIIHAGTSGEALRLERTEQPVLYTIAEAAAVLRIGRTLAYELARRYHTSGGRCGLPVVQFGHCLRVPHAALVRYALSGDAVATAESISERMRPSNVRVAQCGNDQASGDDGCDDGRPLHDLSTPSLDARVARAGRSGRGRSDEQLALSPVAEG
jgi:hypothetical protein